MSTRIRDKFSVKLAFLIILLWFIGIFLFNQLWLRPTYTTWDEVFYQFQNCNVKEINNDRQFYYFTLRNNKTIYVEQDENKGREMTDAILASPKECGFIPQRIVTDYFE